MTAEEVIRLIFSFLGGGLVVAILDWVRTARSERKRRAIDSVEQQLRGLYGPLHFFSNQNEQLWLLYRKFHEAYDHEFVAKQYSENEDTQRRVDQWAKATLDLANEYAEMIVRNNQSILDILRTNWSLTDPDDIGVFSQFQIDYVRLETEARSSKHGKTFLPVYQHIGEISCIRPDFTAQVQRKFAAKQKWLDDQLKRRRGPDQE